MEAINEGGFGERWVDASLQERQRHFRSIFVAHPQLNDCLRTMATLCETRPFTQKGVGIAIWGRPGSGKTTFISYLRHRYPRRRVGEGVEVPFIDITIPRSTTPLNLLLSFLRALGDPIGKRLTLELALMRTTALLRLCKTRMVAVDNVQDIPEARRDRGMQTLGNTLREVCDAGPVLMLFGTEDAQVVVATNDQLKSRVTFDCKLAEFDVGTPAGISRFLVLIDQFERSLPLPGFAGIARTGAGKALALAADGAIGYLARLLAHATFTCVARGGACLNANDLEMSYLATFGLTAMTVNPFLPTFTQLRRLDQPGEPHFRMASAEGRRQR